MKTKRKPRPITFGEETQELSTWAEKLSISESLLAYRIQKWGINVLSLSQSEYYEMIINHKE